MIGCCGVLRCYLTFGMYLIAGLMLQAAVVEEGAVGDKPLRRFVAESGGKRITFYLSNAEAAGDSIPLVVWIEGTGCSSQFGRNGDRITSGLQSLLYSVARGPGRILAVEKPGVEFLDRQPDAGDASTCRPEFRAGYTLDRWAETIAVAIRPEWTKIRARLILRVLSAPRPVS